MFRAQTIVLADALVKIAARQLDNIRRVGLCVCQSLPLTNSSASGNSSSALSHASGSGLAFAISIHNRLLADEQARRAESRVYVTPASA